VDSSHFLGEQIGGEIHDLGCGRYKKMSKTNHWNTSVKMFVFLKYYQ